MYRSLPLPPTQMANPRFSDSAIGMSLEEGVPKPTNSPNLEVVEHEVETQGGRDGSSPLDTRRQDKDDNSHDGRGGNTPTTPVSTTDTPEQQTAERLGGGGGGSGITAGEEAAAAARYSTKVKYRYEYRSLSGFEVVFTQDAVDVTQNRRLDPQRPAFEIITTAYTTREKDTQLANEADKKRAPPVYDWGSTVMVINSPGVIHALRSVVGYYPQAQLSGDSVRVAEPYALLVHHRDELVEYRRRWAPAEAEVGRGDDCTSWEDVYEDLGFLLGFIEERTGRAVAEELERHQREVPVVTHNMLWTLFRPGTDVYLDIDEDGEFNAFVVKSIFWEVRNGVAGTYTVNLWNMECSRTYVGPSNGWAEEIPPFLGERAIGSLAVFPCQYLTKKQHKHSHEEHRAYLEERGAMFYKLQKPKQLLRFDGFTTTRPKIHYAGPAIVDMFEYGIRNPDGTFTSEEIELADDVEEDTKTVPPCKCNFCRDLINRFAANKVTFANYSKINPQKVDRLTPHQYFLCSQRMRAFLLKLREWKHLHVDGFSYPKFQSGLIETLVIPEATRSLLKKLTHRYARSENEATWSADFVKGKGEGMIFLLHGKPGVGKTYTAECVAEETKRPLISLTCSDIGTNPTRVERNLDFWFELAKSWGAILLLDEADVYLEQRSISDLDRNNLVAGFLRKLEYYQGILFLTTNRVGTFDEAFLSRIDVPIYYRDFNDAQRASIWNAFFSKLEREREDEFRVHRSVRNYVKDDEVLLSLKWNAREIRNAFQTAVALAEVEGKKDNEGLIAVMSEHIQKVVDMSKDFKDYLKELYQKDDAARAASRGIRFDEYGEKEGPAGPAPV